MVLIAAQLIAGLMVYRCERDGNREFSDKPCGQDTQLQYLNPLPPANPASANKPARAAPGARAKPSQRSASAAPSHPDQARVRRRLMCAGLQQQIDRVNSLMRAGYSSRRGEQLRARWHQLKQQYYALRCSGAL